MATELAVGGIFPTGSTVVAVVRRDTDEKAWRGTEGFGTWSDTNFNNGLYDVPMVEQGTSGYFVGDFPTAITTAGFYNISYYTRTGSSSPYIHVLETIVSLKWDGSAEAVDLTGLNWITVDDYKTQYGITDTSL